MNKTTIIELLEDGAYFCANEYKLFHPSFRKGWRKLTSNNISWVAVMREHGVWGTKRLTETNNVYRLQSNKQWNYVAPFNPMFLGAQPARNGQDY